MRAHVCSTECPCGHWSRRLRFIAPGKRGKVNLDVLDEDPDGPTYDPDYQENEDEDDQ